MKGRKIGTPPARRLGRRATLWSGTVALGMASTLLAACGGSAGTESGAGAEGGVDEVTFLNVLPMESLTFAPEMIADTCAGSFKEQRLDVTFQATEGSAPAVQSIIAGSALLTRVGDIETIIATGDKHAPVTNVGTAEHVGGIRMVSSTRAPIESPEDFRGKMIGIPSEGGTSEITLDLVLASAGIPTAEVDRQVVGLTPAIFNLVKSGRIDAYVVSLDVAVALERQQPQAVVYNPSEDVTSGAQLYMTSEEQAQDPQARDQIRRYLKAIRSAIDFIVKDEANGFNQTMECISSKYNVPALEDKAVTRESLSTYVDSWTAHGSDHMLETNPQQWAATYQDMVAAGVVDAGLNPKDWYTNAYVPDAP